MSDVEFDVYVPSHVQIRIEHILMTYHDAISNDWNKNTAKEKFYATRLTLRRRMMPFLMKIFQQILMNKCMLFGKILEKFGDD